MRNKILLLLAVGMVVNCLSALAESKVKKVKCSDFATQAEAQA